MIDLANLLGRALVASRARKPLERYAVAVILSLCSLLLTITIEGIGEAPFFSVFVLAILAATAYGGTGPGLFATAATTLASDYFILPPLYSLAVVRADHLLRLLVFVGIGVAVSLLIGAIGDLQRKVDNERERLRVTIQAIGDAVITTDELGRVIYLNPAAEPLTGWTNHEAVAQPLESVFQIFDETTREPVENPVRRVLRGGHVVG